MDSIFRYNDIEFSRDIAFKRDLYVKAEDPYYFPWLPSDNFYGAVALYSDWNVSQMTPCHSQLYRFNDGSCNGFKAVPLEVDQIVVGLSPNIPRSRMSLFLSKKGFETPDMIVVSYSSKVSVS